jgi:hypothetical protein
MCHLFASSSYPSQRELEKTQRELSKLRTRMDEVQAESKEVLRLFHFLVVVVFVMSVGDLLAGWLL